MKPNPQVNFIFLVVFTMSFLVQGCRPLQSYTAAPTTSTLTTGGPQIIVDTPEPTLALKPTLTPTLPKTPALPKLTPTATSTPTLTPTPSFIEISANTGANIRKIFTIDLDQHLYPNYIQYTAFDFVKKSESKASLVVIGDMYILPKHEYQICLVESENLYSCQLSPNPVFLVGNNLYTTQVDNNKVTIRKGINDPQGEEIASFLLPGAYENLISGVFPDSQLSFYTKWDNPNHSTAHVFSYQRKSSIFHWPRGSSKGYYLGAWIGALKYSPDNRYAVIIFHMPPRQALVVFDLEKSIPVKVLRYAWGSEDISFSPDGKQFCTSIQYDFQDIDHPLTCITLEPPFQSRHYNLVKDLIVSASAFSPDGSLIAAAIGDKVVLVQASDGKIVHMFDLRRRVARKLAFSPDSKYLAILLNNFYVEYWGIENKNLGKPTSTPTPFFMSESNFYSVYSPIRRDNLAFLSRVSLIPLQDSSYFDISPSGHLLASWNQKQGVIELWDISEARMLSKIELAGQFAFFSDEELVVPQDNNLITWDISRNLLTTQQICPNQHNLDVRRGSQNVLLCEDKQKKLIEFIDAKTLQTFGSVPLDSRTQNISPDHTFLGYIYEKQAYYGMERLLFVRLHDFNIQRGISGHHFLSFSFSPDSKQIAAAGYVNNPEIWIYDISADRTGISVSPKIIRYASGEFPDVVLVKSYSPTENIVFVCDYSRGIDIDNAVHAIDTVNNRKVHSIPLKGECQDLVISGNGYVLAVRTNQGVEIWTVKPENQRILAVATQIASTSDSLKRIYGPTNGKIDEKRWEKSLNWISANTNRKNYIINFRLKNSISKGEEWPWPFHIAFRQPRTEDYACLLHFSITGKWRFDVDVNGEWRTKSQGEISGYQPGTPFHVMLVVKDDFALLYINDELVDVLQIGDNPKSGDVVLALPLGVEYEDFTVFEIPESPQ